MYFNVIAWVCLCWVSIFGAYIHQVKVSPIDDAVLMSQIEHRFKGSFVDLGQVAQFARHIRLKGVYTSVTHGVDTVDGITTLRFDISQTPRIRSIRFRQLPIWDGRLRIGMKIQVGDLFNYRHLTQDIAYINDLLVEEGYILSSVKSFKLSDDGDLLIDIESPKLSGILFIGLDDTPSWVLYRDMVSVKGADIDRYFLEIDSNTLSSMPYFSSVSSPSIQYISSDNVTVSYRVKERKMNRFDIGLEQLEDDQGVALFSKFKLYHQLIYSDFLSLQAQLGYLNHLSIRNYQMHYQQPWLFNKYRFVFDFKGFLTYRTELVQNDAQPYDTLRRGVSVFLTRPLRRLYLDVGAGVRSEYVSPQDDVAFSSYQLNSLSFYLEHQGLKSLINPKQGHRSKIIIDRGGRIFGAQLGGVDFMRVSTMHSQYFPLRPNVTLAARAFGGLYKKYSDMTTFETEKFSFGGSNSLRGYKEGSFYGNYRLSFNFEPRYHFSDTLIGVVFWDAGVITDALASDISQSFYSGYGVGVRFLNVMLPIRLDVGVGHGVMLHFNVSQTF